MATTNTLIQSLKILLISTGVLFIAIAISLCLSPILSPELWLSFKSWLRPPYLYVIINVIIITIAASSRLLHHRPTEPPLHHHDVISVRADQFSPYDAVSVTEFVNDAGSCYGAVSVKDVEVEVVGSVASVEELPDQPVAVEYEVADQVVEIGGERKQTSVTERFRWTPPPQSPLAWQKALDASPDFLLSERPAASSRFGHHRRNTKASSAEGGKALRVAKPKRHETLECTWKAITEGRHMPLTRHLKKSDMWENQCRQINLLDDLSTLPTSMKKSGTFKDRANQATPPIPSSRLKKESSLSQDELNRRVEAFINKFNEEMRLQRQQSIQQFMEKINRTA